MIRFLSYIRYHCLGLARHFRIRQICLVLVLYSVVALLYFTYQQQHDEQKSYTSLSLFKSHPEYKYSISRGFTSLSDRQHDYVFEWKDWVDLSSIYLDKEEYKKVKVMKKEMETYEENMKRKSHKFKYITPSKRLYKRLALSPSFFSLSSLSRLLPRSPHYDPYDDHSNPSANPVPCDWNRYFSSNTFLRNAHTGTIFRYCSHDNLLAFHTPQPAKIVVLGPDTLNDDGSIHPYSDKNNGEDRTGEDNDDGSNENQVSPIGIDKQTILESLALVSNRYSQSRPFDPNTQTVLKNMTNLLKSSEEGSYDSESLKSLLDNVKFPTTVVLTPVERYRLNHEKLEEQKKHQIDGISVSNGDSTQSIDFLKSKFPTSLSTDLVSQDLYNVYEPTYEELARRASVAIEEEKLLPSLYKSSWIKDNDDNYMLLPALPRKVLDYLPKNWTIPPFSALDADKNTNQDTLPNTEQLFHAHFLNTYALRAAHLPKYFTEYDRGENADHIDYRFFKTGIRANERAQGIPASERTQGIRANERTVLLHHIFRAWSKFTEQEGIQAWWLAHGTLLGWYWTGSPFGWDTDIDIQVATKELERLGRKYNNTMIIDWEEEYMVDEATGEVVMDGDGKRKKKLGVGKYLLEISSRYVSRGYDNGQNVIDGRFIDISSGVYIDITGLSVNSEKSSLESDDQSEIEPEYGCKNNHFYKQSDIFPLRKTLFEGASAHIPNNFVAVLRKEYFRFDEVDARPPNIFNRRLGLWTTKFECRNELKEMESVDKEGWWNMTRGEFLKYIVVGPSEQARDGDDGSEDMDLNVGGYLEQVIEDIKKSPQEILQPDSPAHHLTQLAQKMKVLKTVNAYHDRSNFCDSGVVKAIWHNTWKLSSLHQLEMAYLEHVLDGDRDFSDLETNIGLLKQQKEKDQEKEKAKFEKMKKAGEKDKPVKDELDEELEAQQEKEQQIKIKYQHPLTGNHFPENMYKKSVDQMTKEEFEALEIIIRKRPAQYNRLEW